MKNPDKKYLDDKNYLNDKNYHKPPGAANLLYKMLLPEPDRLFLSGDFDEIYNGLYEEKGFLYARLWYWFQVISSILPILFNSFLWSMSMIRNYIKITFRNIIRQKAFSAINISGLAVGIACFLLISLWVKNELSYDRFHKNSGNIYRVLDELHFSSEYRDTYAAIPHIIAPGLQKQFPEIINSTRFLPGGKIQVSAGGKQFYETGAALADPEFFNMFSFKFVKGNPASVFANPESVFGDPASVVITSRMAEKYFAGADPIGKTVSFNNKEHFKVTGVLENIPENSHIKFDFLVPFDLERRLGIPESSNILYYSYIQLQDNTPLKPFREKVLNSYKLFDSNSHLKVNLLLQPLAKIHLFSNYSFDFSGNGDIKYVYIFLIVAVSILLIGCINFMNLSTARSAKRAREVALRKVVGAARKNLIFQFLGESVLLSFLSMILGLAVVYLLLPAFNEITGKTLIFTALFKPDFSFLIIGITLFTGIISGSYPAFLLSSFLPVSIFRGAAKGGRHASRFRKILVIIQFSLSVFLITCTLVVSSQLDYMRNRKLGINKEHIIYMPMLPGNSSAPVYEAFGNELLKNSNILNAAFASELPADIARETDALSWEGQKPGDNVLMKLLNVNYSFKETFNLNIVQGRFFSREYSTDGSSAFVVNEAAVRAMGMDSPVGKKFTFWGTEGVIIGVAGDFHVSSMHNGIEPLVMRISPKDFNYVFVKARPGNMDDTISFLGKIWGRHNPGSLFEYFFMDEKVDALYRNEVRLGNIFGSFTFLAIFISCLGLFGLAAYMTERRFKEIGIRKVLGSSVTGIVTLLTKEFILWVVTANIIAWPAAWYAMNFWLSDFAYRTNISINIFLFSAFIVILIALATISFQTVKAALANPVKSLKCE